MPSLVKHTGHKDATRPLRVAVTRVAVLSGVRRVRLEQYPGETASIPISTARFPSNSPMVKLDAFAAT